MPWFGKHCNIEHDGELFPKTNGMPGVIYISATLNVNITFFVYSELHLVLSFTNLLV